MKYIVIYDGECGFCKSCVAWVKARREIEAIPNQIIDPAAYGITREQCEKSVVVIRDRTYFSAKAIAELLKLCRHPYLAKFLKLSGPIGEWGYKYVANHRDGKLVAVLHWFVKRTTKN